MVNETGESIPEGTTMEFLKDAGGQPSLSRGGEPVGPDEGGASWVEAGASKVPASEAPARAETSADGASRDSGGGTSGWPRWKKLAVCAGAPAVALVAVPLLVDGGALTAALGSVLGVAAALACPLGMYFMMRRMQGHDRRSGDGTTGPGEGSAARDRSREGSVP
jgi:hypothetical protein